MNRTMLPEEFKEIGTALLEEYGLKGWRIVIHNRFCMKNNVLAFTRYSERSINISLNALKDYDYIFCYNTIKHEIAHALLDQKNNCSSRKQGIRMHGKEWKEYAYNCGLFREELYPYSKMCRVIRWKLHYLNHE